MAEPFKPSAPAHRMPLLQPYFLELGFFMEIFDYDNILLLPRKCRVDSRSECDPSVQFGPRRFKLPISVALLHIENDAVHAELVALQLTPT